MATIAPGTAPALATGPAPWPAPTNAVAYISAAGLPALPQEELTYHVHAHLDVFVNGVAQTVAQYIGIDLHFSEISPLHTHDTSGIIHIEAAAPTAFSLGQFFTEWGVRLDGTCVGGYCSPQMPIAIFVNGKAVAGNPAQVALAAHEEIALTIGTAPAKVPDHYDFPSGF